MKLPELGSNIPNDGNAFSKAFGRYFLKILGWKVLGEVPDLNKLIIIFAPHRSYWDGFYLVLTKIALGIKVSWLVKSSMFFFPLGVLIRFLGAIPVDRRKSAGLVEQIAYEFEKRDKIFLAVAPEGTRKKVDKWKTGFYTIAEKTKVPVLKLYIDYDKKIVGFGDLTYTTGDQDKDINEMRSFFNQFEPGN